MPFAKICIALSVLVLSPLTSSTPTALEPYPGYVHPLNGDCTDYNVKSAVTYSELHWKQPNYTDNYEVVGLLARVATQGKVPLEAFGEPKNVTKTFTLAGTFCQPKGRSPNKETVLVATHGAGFDRRYWASSHKPEDYNFVQYALDAGFSVFYYDRLGVGKSSRISGYEIEANPQVELLAELLKALRVGKYTDGIKPSKLVLVGHSYGSAISTFILARHPELADAAALTGYAFPSREDFASGAAGYGLSIFASRIVSTLPASSKPQFSEKFDDGWLSFGDKFAFTQSFLGAEDYAVPAAEYSFKIRQPYSAVEFLSAFAESNIAKDYKGKVLLAAGERDLFFCAGDCKDTLDRGMQKDVFPAGNVTQYVQDGSGHGQNFALNAKELYGKIVEFATGL